MRLRHIDLIEGRAPSPSGGCSTRYGSVALDTGPGITRLAQQVIAHVVSRRRARAMKDKFYGLPATNLADRCGLDPADLIVPVTENGEGRWSFGHGRAQFLTGELQ
ncbi:hypothetical protein HMPREF0591_0933 [Mycobacterium parascrofulaceum ATCC BAA-614]|uniref:Uncharacterized protein n=1 Tax=Mycobacterium parascrofulaceum ATCC BAA-614 TaxID=525368 RepID=D5P439_9MYCO|nr:MULTISPECIES: tautomerase family protein [Mycobacterium]EFG79228.1 hypothetical protein HMPREF0591_0933 [Mycobacterium parascrofulaceum ATCC BAA-614]